MHPNPIRHCRCLALALAVAACDAPPPAPTTHILAEAPGGTLEEIPCRLLGEHTDVKFRSDAVAVLTQFPLGTSRFGPYYGISGAPVYSASGEFLGAVADTFFDRAGPTFGIRERAHLLDLINEGRDHRPPRSCTTVTDGVDSAQPGASIVTLEVWGDMVVGSTSRIAVRDGDDVAATAHAQLFPTGRWLRAIARAPVLALVLEGDSGRALCGIGPIIGTSTYENGDGAYVRLGVAPPSIDITVRFELDPPELNYARQYHVIADSAIAEEQIQQVLTDAVAAYEPTDSGTATFVIERSGTGGQSGRLELPLTESAIAAIATAVAASGPFRDDVDDRLVITLVSH